MQNIFAAAKLNIPVAVLILFFSALAAFAQSSTPFSINTSPLPAPTGPVNDYVGVFEPSAKQQLDQKLIDFKAKTGVELAVAVVQTTGDRPIFDYSLAVARGWGIGSKDLDNPSALLFIAIADRKYFTQISKDLEDELPDGVAGSLQRQFLIPEFKKGDYAKGITDTIDAYIARINANLSGTGAAPTPGDNEATTGSKDGVSGIFCCIGVIALILLVIWINHRSGGGTGGGGFGSGLGSALPWIIGSVLTSGSGSSSSSGWGGSSGGGGWGGFGGGGDFGGGGAGGSW